MEIFEQIKSYNVTKDLNLKMVLVTGNYTELVNYENPFPNNNTALKQHVLENFNEYCKTCNYIAYTSTITSGVSYDEKTFDKCYAYMSDKGNLYRAFVQQLLRIRHIDSKTYEFYVDSRLEERTRDLIYLPYEYEYCRKLIRTSHQLKNMSIDEINSMRMLECCVPEIDENENRHYNAFVEHVCVHNLKEKLDNKTYFLKCLIELLQFHGMKITYPDDDDNEIDCSKKETIDNGYYEHKCNKLKKYKQIVDAEDITEKEYDRLTKTQLICDEDYTKKMKYQIKGIFYNTINESIVWMMFQSKNKVVKYKTQNSLLKHYLKYISYKCDDDFSKYLKQVDTINDTLHYKRSSYCHNIMKLCGFSSIFDVHGRMDRKEALERLRDNMEWLLKWYHLHKVSYEQTKRENEVPSNNWTNMKILQYINSAL